MTLKHWIDIPPVWLALCLCVAWGQAAWFPMGLSFGGPVADFIGGILAGGGLVLMALAVYEMRRMRTTLIPHQEASALVQSGIFSRTRNPIYLGDAMVLAGLILYWDAVLSLPLVPVFVWWIERHFIIPEENRLRRKFRADFARYCQKTRRWI
ncbi:methyltransferase family protein [Marimonas arenosa]|uniref:Isoprenylcysteine carboxylmethyltransferase family protein n=1 Tax=Marimonas arenosa TaxID=1795305 RepID=A0AAE3WF58_9RHOB|nr:isoprenylcysteine carboxylmethyltransferase family protein [Marimonas arenosa]MDQ2091499.1 isoprenylcysteine carboxylmethyltransferase family protein [Marimonas arenosa]